MTFRGFLTTSRRYPASFSLILAVLHRLRYAMAVQASTELQEINQQLSRWCDEFGKALGNSLQSIVLFGGLAKDEFVPGTVGCQCPHRLPRRRYRDAGPLRAVYPAESTGVWTFRDADDCGGSRGFRRCELSGLCHDRRSVHERSGMLAIEFGKMKPLTIIWRGWPKKRPTILRTWT